MRVLLFDIETAPALAWVWKYWDENISPKQILEHPILLSFAAKWYKEDDIIYEESRTTNDKELVEKLSYYLDAADIVVGHNCLLSSSLALKADLSWTPVGELKVGDELVAFEEEKSKKGRPRQFKKAVVLHNELKRTPTLKVILSDGSFVITTPDHKWLKLAPRGRDYRWAETQNLKPGHRVEKFFTPWTKDNTYEAGWLSGFISGEGTLNTGWNSRQISFCQRPGETLDQAVDYCTKLGLSLGRNATKASGIGKQDCVYYRINGGKFLTAELIGRLQIKRFLEKLDWDNFGSLKSQTSETLSVVAVEDVGENEVAVLTTSTGTFFGEGFAMHNCSKFDLSKVRGRSLVHGIKPFSPVKVVDTLKVARKNFGFGSNSLEYLGEVLGIENKKIAHKKFPGFELWKECMRDNPEAWAEMKEYNIQDVYALEEIYTKMLPWIDNHPSVVIDKETDKPACNNCGSSHVQWRGHAHTNTGKYPRYHCQSCGAWNRGRYTLLKKNENLLRGF